MDAGMTGCGLTEKELEDLLVKAGKKLIDDLSSNNKHKCLSVEAIERVFRYRHPDLAINDIRPLAGDFFKEDYPYGITIWLKNGDLIEYYPALPVDAEEWRHLK